MQASKHLIEQNDRLRMSVNEQIEAFFAKGGKIQQIPMGKVTLDDPDRGFVINPKKKRQMNEEAEDV